MLCTPQLSNLKKVSRVLHAFFMLVRLLFHRVIAVGNELDINDHKAHTSNVDPHTRGGLLDPSFGQAPRSGLCHRPILRDRLAHPEDTHARSARGWEDKDAREGRLSPGPR